MEFNTKNPEINTKKLQLTEHAYLRMEQRFGIKDRVAALGNVRSWVRQGTRIGQVTDEIGNDSILYAYGRIGVYVSTDLTKVFTVKKKEHITHDAIKQEVVELHRRKFNKFERLEKVKSNRLFAERLRVETEIAQLKYRQFKTRSKNVKEYCATHIDQLNNYILELENELNTIKTEKRRIANSMIAVL